MVTKERPPSLRGRNPPPHHIFGHAGLADIDAKLEKLAMDPRGSPQRIGDAHLADKLAYFYRHGRSSAAVLRFPSPIRSKSRTVPTPFKRNGHILLPAQKSSATRKPASTAPPAMSNC